MTNVGETIIRFGRHRGSPLREVPRAYLQWCFDNDIGGPEFYTVVAAFLGMFAVPTKELRTSPPKPKSQHRKKTTSEPYATHDCSHLFNPDSDWPDRQDWDGITPTWLDQGCLLDDEFKRMFQ